MTDFKQLSTCVCVLNMNVYRLNFHFLIILSLIPLRDGFIIMIKNTYSNNKGERERERERETLT